MSGLMPELAYARLESLLVSVRLKTKPDKCYKVLAMAWLTLLLKYCIKYSIKYWSSSVAVGSGLTTLSLIRLDNSELFLHTFLHFVQTPVESSCLVTNVDGFVIRFFPLSESFLGYFSQSQ